MADELPGAPQLDTPEVAAVVTTLTPTLVVRNTLDPEGDAVTYDFEVWGAGQRLGNATGVAAGMGTTSWTVTPALSDEREYWWLARATTAGGSSPWSQFRRFDTKLGVTVALGAPTIVSPQNGTVVERLKPVLVFLPAGGPATFDLELATDEAFTTVVASGMDVTETRQDVSTELTEDARYCWRVRAERGATQTEWVRACFTVSVSNGAPSTPTTFNPSAGGVAETLTPVFTRAAATDPEGEPLTYELEVSSGAEVVGTVTGIGGTAAMLKTPLRRHALGHVRGPSRRRCGRISRGGSRRQ